MALKVSLYTLNRITGNERGSQWGRVRNHLVGRCSSRIGPQGGTPNPMWLERVCPLFQEFRGNFHVHAMSTMGIRGLQGWGPQDFSGLPWSSWSPKIPVFGCASSKRLLQIATEATARAQGSHRDPS